jgi:hypothetical protein
MTRFHSTQRWPPIWCITWAGIVPNDTISFRARLYRGADLEPSSDFTLIGKAAPRVCVDIPRGRFAAGLPPDAAERYVIVDIQNGYAPGPLRAHLYDLGEQGFRLVGIERPESSERP